MTKGLKDALKTRVENTEGVTISDDELDKLVKNRKSTPDATLPELFPNTYDFFKNKFPHLSEDAFKLLTRKGVYPYSYMDSHTKFAEDKLPPIEAYRNDLIGEELSEDEYKIAKDIWDTFQLQNLTKNYRDRPSSSSGRWSI